MSIKELSDQLAQQLAKGGLTKHERAVAVHAWAQACKALLAGHR
jgi:hypothetical protein